MKRILTVFVTFFGILCVFTVVLYAVLSLQQENSQVGEQLVMCNEIRYLSLHEDGVSPAEEAIHALEENLRQGDIQQDKGRILQICGIFLLLGTLYAICIFWVIYRKIWKPFQRLESYAEDIAGGNLEVSLPYERTNFFGAFTWAFDHMRKEIQFARKKEAEAIEANKTIIASLSHDIKTPIASIRAYSEALEANLEMSYEKRQRYVATMMKKCDEVTYLVNDLVLHSLSELEKLEIKCESIKIRDLIEDTVKELEFEQLLLVEPVAEAQIWGDGKRIAQILENLLNNARKYAPDTMVEISGRLVDDWYQVSVKDHGSGIPPEDMPFIKDKFYRGHNTKDMPGSGLGLYIVDYLIKEMQGEMELWNDTNGLEVILRFRIFEE